MQSVSTNAISAFGSALVTRLLTNTRGTLVASPFSVWATLAMAEGASVKDSAASDQLREMLRFDLVEGDVHRWFQDICLKISTSDKMVRFTAANAVFAMDEVQSEYIEFCMSVFSAEVFQLQTRGDINDFVYNNTDGMIQEILSEDPCGPSVLVNAVLFQGDWNKAFDKSSTIPGTFTPFGLLSVACKMMTMTDKRTPFKQTRHSEIVRLDYGNANEYSAFIVVPIGKDIASLDKVVYELFGTDTSWEKALYGMKEENVKLYLPRFVVQGGCDDLTKCIQEMGATSVFEPGGLSLMTSSKDTSMGQIAHKSRIEVNETGTTAAAATSVSTTRGFCQINIVKADRPFLFVVLHSKTNTLLFVARVNSITE
jgi:serine protease inhibitor